jgi:hypothetical protein
MGEFRNQVFGHRTRAARSSRTLWPRTRPSDIYVVTFKKMNKEPSVRPAHSPSAFGPRTWPARRTRSANIYLVTFEKMNKFLL